MCQWHAKEYGHTAADRSSQMIAPAFDPVALELWPYLTLGGSVHVMPDKVRASPVELVRWLTTTRITAALFATPVAETVIHETWPDNHCLRFMTSGGDKLHRGSRVPQRFRFDNHYGPSENTIITTFCTIPSLLTTPPPIGKAVANTTCVVLDRYRQPVPIGVPGELYVGGDCLARGYWNRVELTKERFIHSPFDADPAARLYKTGDLVRYLPDGQLEFLGRVDLQVKIRGFRIELGEIESVLTQHSSISECCVEVREPKAGNKQLVGYVVWGSNLPTAPTIEALRAFLKETLPEYMVPAAFVVLPKLPLTANGKVDRRLLPEPDWRAAGASGHALVPPSTPTQHTLVDTWKVLLGLPEIGIHDNFFDLGGHSLTAAKLLSKIRETFHLELAVAKIFEEPTVERLAATIDNILQFGMGAAAGPAADVSQDAARVWASSGLADRLSQLWTSRPDAWAPSRLAELSAAPKNVFLTGASGYLGAFLLEVLLTQTTAVIHCLVRAKDPTEGVGRLWTNLHAYGLDTACERHASRMRAVCGDLGKPLLGLSAAAFDVLADEVDVIYHCGALVNSVLPYSQLKGPNVLGTLEVLRLSCQRLIKPVHHISTLSVFPEVDYHGAVTERTPLPSAETLKEGYAISKWVADQLIWCAYRAGLPVALYRPGRITGHHVTGVASVEDVMCRMTKGCLQLEAAPDLDWLLDMTPVDFVSHGIVALSRTVDFAELDGALTERRGTGPAGAALPLPDAILSPVFHLCNAAPMAWVAFVAWMNKFGYACEQLPYVEWRARLIEVVRQIEENGGEAKPDTRSHFFSFCVAHTFFFLLI
jgi:thioester reductase-like protein